MGLLDGKKAIVTGGTRGIGLEIALTFLKEGASVLVGARREPEGLPEGIVYRRLDVSDPKSCEQFVSFAIQSMGRIDILVNDAGIMTDRMTKKMTDEDFDSVISTNTKGTFNMVRLVAPLMQDNGYGSIVNFSSFVARQGSIGQANYVASKAAIEGMTRCWAREFSRHGENVRVNAVAPGVVLTDIFADTKQEIIDGFASKTMLKRLGTTKEIANAVLFLSSDMASYVTGTVLAVDGGISF